MKATLKAKTQNIMNNKNFKEEDAEVNNNMIKTQKILEKNEINMKKYDLIKERLAKLENKSLEEIVEIADEKRKKRGGFEEKIFLEKVVEK